MHLIENNILKYFKFHQKHFLHPIPFQHLLGYAGLVHPETTQKNEQTYSNN